MIYIACPQCKGKGHVMNMEAMILVPVFSWIIHALEKDDPKSDTRIPCPACKGKKVIKIDENKI